ncbi:hypothetical protein KFL_006330020 [Klebsormidium nitens]|uniref:Uncharacterized protein n=1 Tax=Klebsormidium nitens TaxID=105231 RepID=A0A1Y1IHM3_KLENI|nr:hypothetical protein KFL_006330020 [Klebsormidium nitens]|eukprot:GAQ90375.1 hypothetical protein KFL_006330020 [Klebsormidium nitens]
MSPIHRTEPSRAALGVHSAARGDSRRPVCKTAPQRELQVQRQEYSSRIGSGSLKGERMLSTGQRRFAVNCLLSFGNPTSSGKAEDGRLAGGQFHQAGFLQSEIVAFQQQAYQTSPAGFDAAELLWQVWRKHNITLMLAGQEAAFQSNHVEALQQDISELRQTASWEAAHALSSAVSPDFDLDASMARLRLDALGEEIAGGGRGSAASLRLVCVALAGSFLGQVLNADRALGEAVANESGATVMEATGQVVAQSGSVPSWLQPAILAAPLLLYGGFYWYRENVNQRLSPFDYVTLLLVVLAGSNLFLAVFFQIRLF